VAPTTNRLIIWLYQKSVPTVESWVQMALRKRFLVVQAGEPIRKTLEPAVRYRGFVLIPQPDLSWLVRPERSPMHVLPFRAPACSISDVKALVDWRLARLGRDRRPRLDLLPKQTDSRGISPSQLRLEAMAGKQQKYCA